MGKRGKAARKRRRENDLAATIISNKFAKHHYEKVLDTSLSPREINEVKENGNHDLELSDDDEAGEARQCHPHGISDEALGTTISTLHILCGMNDPVTGKAVLKDKRYRSLRRVLYEIQGPMNGTTSSVGVVSLTGVGTGIQNNQSNPPTGSSLPNNIIPGNNTSKGTNLFSNFSTSKITNEISRQIEHGAWESAISTLKNLRKIQEESISTQSESLADKNSADNSNLRCLRPKLGALQRWVREVDAAGTEDPVAMEVLDAMLRVVAPEVIFPVSQADLKKAVWSKLGGNVSHTDGDGNGRGNGLEGSIAEQSLDESSPGGRIRLFPAFCQKDEKCNGQWKDFDVHSTMQGSDNKLNELVKWMEVGEDGIRRISKIDMKERRSWLFRTCGYENGADRKPPNKHDLELVTTSPIDEQRLQICDESDTVNSTVSGTSILFNLTNQINHPTIVKTPIPYVHDTFLLENVLSPTECNRLIAAAETAGYKPDEPLAGQPGASILAHACVWIVDKQLEREIFKRVKEFLPIYREKKKVANATLELDEEHLSKDDSDGVEKFEPLGLNRRFRFYRYVPGRYYRPHIDGAWPPSGFDEEGNYRYDICNEENKNGLQFIDKERSEKVDIETSSNSGIRNQQNRSRDVAKDNKTNKRSVLDRRQLSRLTFLIYLNDDFDGGHTTYLIPAHDKEGVLNAFPVKPIQGGVLVFPHGTCAAPLHEGSPVLKRCKYVVRTEVEYYV